MIGVLFVCTGNICRSPTAEGVFRHLVREAGIGDRFKIDSAGLDSCHIGEKPDVRAIKVAKKNGISLEGQKARLFKPEDYAVFDYIFAMDGGHMYELGSNAPEEAKPRLKMFLAAAPHLGVEDVPDPWYGEEADFEKVFDLVHEGSKAILREIREERGL